MKLYAGPNDKGKRLDVIVRKIFSDVPLSALFRAIRKGKIRVNGKKILPSQHIKEHDCIEYQLSSSLAGLPRPSDAPQPINTLFENEELLCLNKEEGEDLYGNLLINLRGKLQNNSDLAFRPSPVNRLDRPTSGIVLIAKSIQGAREASRLFRERKITKTYYAALNGKLDGDQLWDAPLIRDRYSKISYVSNSSEAKEAKSMVSAIHYWKMGKAWCSLAKISMKTGRTHQIRSHAAHYHYPLLGDSKYGGPPTANGFFLHASDLNCGETHPFFPAHIAAPLGKGQWNKLQGMGYDLESVF